MADLESTAEVLLASHTPAARCRATHKIVFEYADSDDDEGTSAQVPVAAEVHHLTMDAADLEGPIVDPPRPTAAAATDGSGSDDGEDFIEDTKPLESVVIAIPLLPQRHVLLPDDLLPIPRAPDARFRTLRVQRHLNTVLAPPAQVDEEMSEAERAQEEEDAARALVKRDRDVKVTADGYHLTVDERDLVDDWQTGLTRHRRPPRSEASFIAEGEQAADLLEKLVSTVASTGDEVAAMPSPSPSLKGADTDENDDDEEDEENEEDVMMDDLLLVAAVEQMMRCCEAAIEELRGDVSGNDRTDEINAFKTLVEEGRSAHGRLCNDEITPTDFATLMRPFMGRVYGAMKRATRPPKAEPIVINGVVMDM
jgi:hypothetical protein